MRIAGELPIEEECPACKSEIPFRDIRAASCNNGHPWSEYLKVGFPGSFCSLAWKQFSSMLDHHARPCDLSGTNVPWVYTKDVFPCPVGFRWLPTRDRGEPVDSRGPASCDPMFVLRESVCVPPVASSTSSFDFSCWFAQFSLCYDITVLAPSVAGVYRKDGGGISETPWREDFFERSGLTCSRGRFGACQKKSEKVKK